MRHKRSLLENVTFLIVIGILAGALGGLAIGVVTGKAPSSSTSAAK